MRRAATALIVWAACAASTAGAQESSGAALVKALQNGGYVVVMRHAHAPQAPPDPSDADPANRNDERQLDGQGRASAIAMGNALHALGIRIGSVWSSPTYRARQTARLVRLPSPKIVPELGDNGHSMQSVNDAQGSWLRRHANATPRRGTDTVIVTQYPNISAAFGEAAAGMKDGEALVFRPSASAPQVVGRIGIDQWPLFAERLKEERHHGA